MGQPDRDEPRRWDGTVELCNDCGGLVGWTKFREGCCLGGVVCKRTTTRFVEVVEPREPFPSDEEGRWTLDGPEVVAVDVRGMAQALERAEAALRDLLAKTEDIHLLAFHDPDAEHPLFAKEDFEAFLVAREQARAVLDAVSSHPTELADEQQRTVYWNRRWFEACQQLNEARRIGDLLTDALEEARRCEWAYPVEGERKAIIANAEEQIEKAHAVGWGAARVCSHPQTKGKTMRVQLDMHLDTARVLLEQAEHGHAAGIGGELSAEAPRELADAIRVAENAEREATSG